MRTNQEIIEILDSLRNEKGMSISELARQVDMAKSAVSRYFNNTREFPLNRVNDFARVLGTTSEYILGFDKHEDFNNILPIYNQLNETNQTKVYNFAEKTLENQNNNVIDLREYRDIDIQSTVSAGTGVVDLDANHIERISYNGFIPNNYDAAFRVQGDSMEPVFQDGEIVFVVKDEDVRNGQIGVVLIDGEAFIKKMYVEGDKLRLVSLNKQYEDIIANGSNQISVYGRVVL
ncbi:XRE family transcriptional regulator [Vagococcus salmoninarum]|uniref:XRE family transcriptional regulator n=1 Tax=Vagococcus salmoninarum TaxID=2739 RepID=UPI0028D4E859|nr:XRE family transcriptional regulator [Vagococcus salmoninarum]